MTEPILHGTVDLSPLIKAAARVDVPAVEAALDRLTDDEVAFVADLTQFLNRRAGMKVSERLAAKARNNAR